MPVNMELLIKKADEVLKASGKIVVLGWKASNHDEFTRKVENTGRVRFYNKDPISICSGNMLIWTRFVGHSSRNRLRNQPGIVSHSNYLNMGELRRFLRGVGAMILDESTPKSPEPIAQRTTKEPTGLAIQTEPDQKILGSDMAFAHDFFESVDHDPSGTLSKFEASKLLRKHFGETAVASRFNRLLEKIVAEGDKKAGRYKATSYLMDLMTKPVQSTDPDISTAPKNRAEEDLAEDAVSRLGALLAKKPALLEERARLKEKLLNVEKQLEKIDRITAVLSEIEV